MSQLPKYHVSANVSLLKTHTKCANFSTWFPNPNIHHIILIDLIDTIETTTNSVENTVDIKWPSQTRVGHSCQNIMSLQMYLYLKHTQNALMFLHDFQTQTFTTYY